MALPNRLTESLRFTRRERIGILALLLILLLFFLLPAWLPRYNGVARPHQDTAWAALMEQLEDTSAAGSSREDSPVFYQYDIPPKASAAPGRLFVFDPNSLDAAGWRELGLRPKTIQTIQNYLAKGGRFRKPEDLGRIYGLKAAEYDRLAPFIRIESAAQPQRESEYAGPDKRDQPARPQTALTPVDINLADTSAFISLPGIGSRLAARIVNFREKLGGFYSIDQIRETYGLPDSVFQKIKPRLMPGSTPVNKISINTATIDELKAHPYIRYELARPIIAYRDAHGPFLAMEDLKKIPAITAEKLEKIRHYITLP